MSCPYLDAILLLWPGTYKSRTFISSIFIFLILSCIEESLGTSGIVMDHKNEDYKDTTWKIERKEYEAFQHPERIDSVVFALAESPSVEAAAAAAVDPNVLPSRRCSVLEDQLLSLGVWRGMIVRAFLHISLYLYSYAL